MFRLLLQAVLLIAVIAISESNETQQDDVEKRGQQTLADVIKQLASVNKELSDLKTKFVRMQMSRLRLMRGKDGRDGKDGKDGTPGTSGQQGRDGKDGAPGSRGPRGFQGLSGRQGRNGKDGAPGPQGPRGLQGPSGKQGRDGKDGAPGSQGPRGSQGPSGRQGPRGPPGRNGGGVEYIRWGKTSCPAGADKVYKGLMGGGPYNRNGGGSNYVCLTKNPKYLNYKPGLQGASYMYGTEYQVHEQVNPFSKSKLGDHDAPCVACHVKTRSAKLMIPATYQCPLGWTREYYGYLMAERNNHSHSTEYICVDINPEVVPGTHANHNGALLYAVEGVCGSLPCLPYVQGRELTCVVCTK